MPGPAGGFAALREGAGFAAGTARSVAQNQGPRDWNPACGALVALPMALGPSSRPNEPLHVGAMLLALVVAALLGGASGLVWHWLAGDENPAEEEELAGESSSEASATPTPSPTIAPPRPSPGG